MIHFSEIKGIELFVDNQRVYGNKIAAAVVGGLFLGIVGLLMWY